MLVAQGFTQRLDINFDVKIPSWYVWNYVSISTNKLSTQLIDAVISYSYGSLILDIYMNVQEQITNILFKRSKVTP